MVTPGSYQLLEPPTDNDQSETSRDQTETARRTLPGLQSPAYLGGLAPASAYLSLGLVLPAIRNPFKPLGYAHQHGSKPNTSFNNIHHTESTNDWVHKASTRFSMLLSFLLSCSLPFRSHSTVENHGAPSVWTTPHSSL